VAVAAVACVVRHGVAEARVSGLQVQVSGEGLVHGPGDLRPFVVAVVVVQLDGRVRLGPRLFRVLGILELGLARLGLARVGLARLGLARVGLVPDVRVRE
jgi:hypothetical protein